MSTSSNVTGRVPTTITISYDQSVIRTPSERYAHSLSALRASGMGRDKIDQAADDLSQPRTSHRYQRGLNALRASGLISNAKYRPATDALAEIAQIAAEAEAAGSKPLVPLSLIDAAEQQQALAEARA